MIQAPRAQLEELRAAEIARHVLRAAVGGSGAGCWEGGWLAVVASGDLKGAGKEEGGLRMVDREPLLVGVGEGVVAPDGPRFENPVVRVGGRHGDVGGGAEGGDGGGEVGLVFVAALEVSLDVVSAEGKVGGCSETEENGEEREEEHGAGDCDD